MIGRLQPAVAPAAAAFAIAAGGCGGSSGSDPPASSIVTTGGSELRVAGGSHLHPPEPGRFTGASEGGS